MATDGIILEYIMGGGLLAIAGFSMATYRAVGKIKEDESQKRSRVYQRLDEVKNDAETKFVHKDMCQVLHKQMSDNIVDIKADIKLLLRQNGISKDG